MYRNYDLFHDWCHRTSHTLPIYPAVETLYETHKMRQDSLHSLPIVDSAINLRTPAAVANKEAWAPILERFEAALLETATEGSSISLQRHQSRGQLLGLSSSRCLHILVLIRICSTRSHRSNPRSWITIPRAMRFCRPCVRRLKPMRELDIRDRQCLVSMLPKWRCTSHG